METKKNKCNGWMFRLSAQTGRWRATSRHRELHRARVQVGSVPSPVSCLKWRDETARVSPNLDALTMATVQQWHTSVGHGTIPRRGAASGSENLLSSPQLLVPCGSSSNNSGAALRQVNKNVKVTTNGVKRLIVRHTYCEWRGCNEWFPCLPYRYTVACISNYTHWSLNQHFAMLWSQT